MTPLFTIRSLTACGVLCSSAALAHVTYGALPEDGLEILEPGRLAAQMMEVPAH